MSEQKIKKIRNFMIRKGVCQASDIMAEFTLTRSTVNTYLCKIDVSSSFNRRVKYYIVKGEHQFDENGFYFVDDIGFYQGGTLLKAICNLVERSSAGMGARELDNMLKTTTHTQLTVLFRKGLISREKATCRAGNAFYYFSIDEQKGKKQRSEYFNPTPVPVEVKEVEIVPEELTDVVEILVNIIKNPEYTAKSVFISLKRSGKDIPRALVDRVFGKYFSSKKNS